MWATCSPFDLIRDLRPSPGTGRPDTFLAQVECLREEAQFLQSVPAITSRLTEGYMIDQAVHQHYRAPPNPWVHAATMLIATPSSRAVAGLLSLTKRLELPPLVTFRALSCLADSYLPHLGGLGGRPPLLAASSSGPGLLEGDSEWQLLLAAAACVLLVVRGAEDGGGAEQRWGQQEGPRGGGQRSAALARVYTAAGQALGQEFEARFSSDDLLEAERQVAQAVGGAAAGRETTADLVAAFFEQIQHVSCTSCFTRIYSLHGRSCCMAAGAAMAELTPGPQPPRPANLLPEIWAQSIVPPDACC